MINPQVLTTLIALLTKNPPKSVLEVHNENALIGYCIRTYFPNIHLDCVTPYSIDYARLYNTIYDGDILRQVFKSKYDVIFHHSWEYDKQTGATVLEMIRAKARRLVIILSLLEWYGRGVLLWTPEDFKLRGANIYLCHSETKDRSFLAVFCK